MPAWRCPVRVAAGRHYRVAARLRFFRDVACVDVQVLVVGEGVRQWQVAVDVGDVELCTAVGKEVQQHVLAAAVEFSGNVVDEDDGVAAVVSGNQAGLRKDEGADEGFLLAARVVVRDVAPVCVEADVGAVDAVAGVFELAVAFVVGGELCGEIVARPAALVVDVDGVKAAEFGVVGIECLFEGGEVGAAVGVDAAAGFAKDVVPGGEIGGAPVLPQRGVAVFQGVVVALPVGEEGGVVVVEAVVEVAAAVFRTLVDEGEVVAVEYLVWGEGGKIAQGFEVFAVETQAVFARAFFDAEQVFAPAALDAGDEAQVRFVVVDEVTGLVFAEAFTAPQEVEGFEQGGFAAAVVAADEGAARV